ncbi:MAG: ABC transporter ATP-binding protein [Defluviitaleaceae bacterium]|nr:ABC transporter ATP-binding protein [Defluviitaleaceae bacterium]
MGNSEIPQEIAIKTENLSKSFKSVMAVDSINMIVPKNCICGFLGKNGAGKTTTIKMLAGLKRPTQGNIFIMGKEQVFGKASNRQFGYLPDVPNFYTYMNGEEYLKFSGKIWEMPDDVLKIRIAELLELVGLSRTKTRIGGYSRGMKQRLGIAQAMLNNPPLIFLDEPISALDPIGRRDVVNIISSLKNTTVLFSTHIMSDVESICDYVIIVDKGKIKAQDYIKNLVAVHAKNSVRVRFFAPQDSEAFLTGFGNVLEVTHINERELEINSKDENQTREKISAFCAKVSSDLKIGFENLSAKGITLEEIFYKSIGEEIKS